MTEEQPVLVIRARDRDEAQSRISGVFSPHRLEVIGPASDLDVLLRVRRTGSITIADISHGTEVVVRPGRLESYYEINLPVRGRTLSICGREEFESEPGKAVILTPVESSFMRWSPDCAQLGVKMSRLAVERTIEGVLGRPPDEAVRFAIGFDVSGGLGRNWVHAVALLRDSLDRGAPDMVVRPLEELVVAQLLIAQPHNFSGRLSGSPRPVRPRSLARVIEQIEREANEPLTAAELAKTAGTSVRSLQAAFAEHLGMSPMGYLRRVRLARAHQDLLAAVPGDGQKVTDIAYRWGFGHVPRFAAAYRDRYGVPPSQTLRS